MRKVIKSAEFKVFVAEELRQLDIPRVSLAYYKILEGAIAARSVLTHDEIKQYIVDCLEYMPEEYLHICN